METWRGVLRENSNYDLAYAQIGKSLLRQKDYAQAMAYFKLGNFRGDRVVLDSGYNKAFTQYRRELLMQWWWAFLLGAVLVVARWLSGAGCGAKAAARPCARCGKAARRSSGAFQSICCFIRLTGSGI